VKDENSSPFFFIIIFFMKKIIFAFLVLLASCKQYDEKTTDERAAVMQADKDFSATSASKGVRYAFIKYIDTTGVLLRPNHDPLKGVRAEQFIEQMDDSTSSLVWEPDTAIISSNNDLAYTYGKYYIKNSDTSVTGSGTYITVWKKQKDGSWKFVLDSGNPGLSKKSAY
jgi:ketosteroid isomerase-like protein